MSIKPQDIVVALKLCLIGPPSSYAHLAKSLGMSASEAHAAVRRLGEARLIDPGTKEVRRREVFLNFLWHGVPYVFPARPSGISRGLPTAWAAPVFKPQSAMLDQGYPPVWPDPEGTCQGTAIPPLYSSVPFASRQDPELYDLLALVDGLRIGRARERAFAREELGRRLNDHAVA